MNKLEQALTKALNKVAIKDGYLKEEKQQIVKSNNPTQLQKVIEYFIINNNEPTHYKDLAIELEILIPNMRRILGQGELKGIFNRVYKGVYNFNN